MESLTPKGVTPLLREPTDYLLYFFLAPAYRTRQRMGRSLAIRRGRQTSRPQSLFRVILSGALEMEWREQGTWRELKAGPGDVVYGYPSNDFYEANSESPRLTAYVIQVEWQPPHPGLPLLTHDKRGLVRLLAGEMLAIYLDDLAQPLKRLLLKQYFLAMVAELLRLNVPGPLAMEERLRVFVEEHRTERFGVTELARHFGYGKRQFQALYKAATGRTPMADVRRAKAEYARVVILNLPDLPLKAVGPRVGVRDARELTCLLKRHYGTPARSLQRSVRRVRARSPETPPEKRVNSA